MVKVTHRLDSAIFNQPAFRRSLVQLVTRQAFDLESRMKISIQQGSKTGRVYRRGAIKKVVGARTARTLGLKRSGKKFVVGFRFHRASAPGEAPASDSTHLANSIVAKKAKSDSRGVHADVDVNASYGKLLEEGTTKMKARPYVAPAIKKEEPRFVRSLDQLIAKAVA